MRVEGIWNVVGGRCTPGDRRLRGLLHGAEYIIGDGIAAGEVAGRTTAVARVGLEVIVLVHEVVVVVVAGDGTAAVASVVVSDALRVLCESLIKGWWGWRC